MTEQPVRCDWSIEEVRVLFHTPVLELAHRAAAVHRLFHDPSEIQVCKLISVKTGGCPEDCSYCSQSSRHQTDIQPTPLMEVQDVLEIARRAKENGVSRICMGAAWREVRDNKQFDRVLEMVRGANALGVEVCCTLGMLTEEQAKRLEAAGLFAYNHNLDTSEDFYSRIITTRTYQDRLKTIDRVRKTSVTVCSGGIIGLGESQEDRIAMLHTLATMQPHPDSVPINILSRVPGTPLEQQPDVPFWDTLRMIAAARILMPRATVRLSAGRASLAEMEQALCFMAGANSIFSSETRSMLTAAVPSPDYEADLAMLERLGLQPRPPFKDHLQTSASSAPSSDESGREFVAAGDASGAAR